MFVCCTQNKTSFAKKNLLMQSRNARSLLQFTIPRSKQRTKNKRIEVNEMAFCRLRVKTRIKKRPYLVLDQLRERHEIQVFLKGSFDASINEADIKLIRNMNSVVLRLMQLESFLQQWCYCRFYKQRRKSMHEKQ